VSVTRAACVAALGAAIFAPPVTASARAAGPSPIAAARPNILWIIAEDLGPQFAVYGTPGVKTPNIDALAAQGVRFTRAFTTAPVCSPSRSAFMTGMYQTSIDAQNHRAHRKDGFELPAGVRTLPDRLRDAGYFTANVKALTADESDRFLRGSGKVDVNFTVSPRLFDSDSWADLKTRRPFYAQLNFQETHRGGPPWNDAHKRIPTPADPAKVSVPPYYPDHPLVRQDWAQYLNSVMALDVKVGFVLRKLEADGLADDTIVVLMADNGQAMVRGKQWPYDSGLHIPLIIRWPAKFPAPAGFAPGTVTDRLVASIDLTAATLTMAGVAPPLTMQGRSFLDPGTPVRQYVFGARDRCDETVDRIRSVRYPRYRYIRNFMPERPFTQPNGYKEKRYPVLGLMKELHAQNKLGPLPRALMAPRRPPEELYDLDRDPHETKNLAAQPAHRHTLARLRAALDTWMIETNDLGHLPEPESARSGGLRFAE
jgi:arylsulfatase A-like enzyme